MLKLSLLNNFIELPELITDSNKSVLEKFLSANTQNNNIPTIKIEKFSKEDLLLFLQYLTTNINKMQINLEVFPEDYSNEDYSNANELVLKYNNFVKNYNTNKRIKLATNISAAAGTIGITTPVAVNTYTTQAKPFDSKNYDQRLLQIGEQRDKPINTIPIIMAHNAGTNPGNSTMPISSNQHLSVNELLDNTPTRGLQFSINVDPKDGSLICQHGADVNSSTIDRSHEPLTVEKQISIINDWANKHPDQVLIVQITNLSKNPDDAVKINDVLTNKFGDKAFGFNDYYTLDIPKDPNASKWPSINDLVSKNKNIVLLTSNITNNNNISTGIPSKDIEFGNTIGCEADPLNPNSLGYFGEDRTLLGNLTQHTYLPLGPMKDIQTPLTTNDTNERINKGGLIVLDQISSNDPRLIDPSKRINLAKDPDVAVLHGVNITNRGVGSATLHSTGVMTTSIGGLVPLFSTAYKIYNIEQSIKELPSRLAEIATNINQQDLLKYLQQNGINPEEITDSHIKNYCTKQLLNQMSLQVFETGINLSSSMAGNIFAFGLLFPPVMPILSLTSMIVAASGVAITTIATLIQRRRISRIIDKTKSDDFKLNIDLKSFANNNFMDKTTNLLSNASLLLRISAMAKYAIPFIGKLSAGGLVFVGTIKSAVDIFANYRARQNNLKDIPAFMQNTINTEFDINKKKYVFFGKTLLEQYKDHLTKQNKIFDNISTEQLQQDAFNYYLTKDFQKYKSKHKSNGNLSNDEEKKLFQQFMQDKLLATVSKDVRNSSIANTLKLGLLLAGGISLIFPPASLFVAAGIILTSTIVSPLVARREKIKCLNQIEAQQSEIENFIHDKYNAINPSIKYQVNVNNTNVVDDKPVALPSKFQKCILFFKRKKPPNTPVENNNNKPTTDINNGNLKR